MKKLQTLHPIDAFGIQKVSLSGIRVEKLEDRIKPGVPFPHKHDFYQVLLVGAGSGHHQIDFKNHKVSPGTIFMMKPGQTHSWDLSQGVRGLLVEFNYQSLNAFKESSKLMNDFSFSPDVLSCEKKAFQELWSLALIMQRESDLKKENHDLSLQGFVTSFLIQLGRFYKGPARQEKAMSTIERFRDLLEKNFKEAHTVDFYAGKMNTSTKALTMQLSRSIGKPPRDLIQERILLEAKRYLAFSDLSVAEIGYELGFDDANYFTRFFRVHEKKSPAQFRKSILP